MPPPERAACKRDRDTINNSRTQGWTAAAGPTGRAHPISDHVAWRTIWENQLRHPELNTPRCHLVTLDDPPHLSVMHLVVRGSESG